MCCINNNTFSINTTNSTNPRPKTPAFANANFFKRKRFGRTNSWLLESPMAAESCATSSNATTAGSCVSVFSVIGMANATAKQAKANTNTGFIFVNVLK